MPNQPSPLSSRLSAFEQWSQGGGSEKACWTITRAEAAYLFATLRGEIEQLRAALNSSRAYRESQEGLPEGTLPRV